MNLLQANQVASRIYAFGDGALAKLPSNVEIRELVGFLRSVIPHDKFDRSLLDTIQTEPLRISESFADQIRSQFNLANEIIEHDQKLKQKLLGEASKRVPSEPQGSETFVALSVLGYGLITVASIWQLDGYWQWLAIVVLVSIPVAMIAAIRSRRDDKTKGLDSTEFSCGSSCDATSSGDSGGGD